MSSFNAYREQRIRAQAVLDWAQKELREGEWIFVSLEGFVRNYVMQNGRILRARLRNQNSPSIIICEPRGLGALTQGNTKGWSPLFRSPLFEAWENTARFIDRIPARHGLPDKDSLALLAIARKVLRQTLSAGNEMQYARYTRGFERYNNDIVSVNMTAWIKGEFRASMTVIEKPLVEAIVDASMGLADDIRCRPIEEFELEDARLEITVWSTLAIPLLSLEVARGDVYHTKAYLIYNNGKICGCRIPSVFNCARFRNLDQFLSSMTKTEGERPYEKPIFFISETHGWIESEDKTHILGMRGPVVRRQRPAGDLCLSLRSMVESATLAANGLISLQEPNGYVESIIDPFESYPKKNTHWVRLAFGAYALALFGSEIKNESYCDAARRLYSYVSKRLGLKTMPDQTKILIEAYLGRTAQVLRMGSNEVQRAAEVVAREAPLQSYEPIFYLQCSVFLHGVADNAFHSAAENLYRTAANRFFTDGPESEWLSLAAYAEIIALAPIFDDAKSVKCVENWYKSFQNYDGSFYSRPVCTTALARSTGKVFEVMADNPTRYEKELLGSAAWMMEMQYTKQNLYFMPDVKKREMLIGGFRHDAGNQQAWIDAAAHYLIGVARLHRHCLFG